MCFLKTCNFEQASAYRSCNSEQVPCIGRWSCQQRQWLPGNRHVDQLAGYPCWVLVDPQCLVTGARPVLSPTVAECQGDLSHLLKIVGKQQKNVMTEIKDIWWNLCFDEYMQSWPLYTCHSRENYALFQTIHLSSSCVYHCCIKIKMLQKYILKIFFLDKSIHDDPCLWNGIIMDTNMNTVIPSACVSSRKTCKLIIILSLMNLNQQQKSLL